MLTPSCSTRRQFLATAAAAAAIALRPGALAAEASVAGQLPIIGFTKPFQKLNFQDTADMVAEIGWSGVECPLREKGQILPERVEEDLPKMHEALKKRGLTVSILATDIRSAATPHAEKVLRTASRLGVKRYRLGHEYYDMNKPIPPQLAEIKARLRDLAALNKELGISGGIQNHSGSRYVGAPVWDLYELVKEFDPQHLGVIFDIGHATVEGGTSWPIHARLVEPHLTAVYVKDFAWENSDKGWRAKWGPLGGGMVRREFFTWLLKSRYRGPISQHVEYLEGSGRDERTAMKKDCDTLKSWLAEAQA